MYKIAAAPKSIYSVMGRWPDHLLLTKLIRCLPRETLFEEIHRSLVHPVPDSFPDIVRHRSRPTDADGHRAHSILNFVSHDLLRIGPSGIHEHPFAPAGNLSSVLWLGDEHGNSKDLGAAGHGQDLVHPRTHPLELFRVTYRPDENDFACRYSGEFPAGKEIPDVCHLMGNAHTTGEK